MIYWTMTEDIDTLKDKDNKNMRNIDNREMNKKDNPITRKSGKLK